MSDPAIIALKALKEAEASCTRCELFRNATQVVPGEGPVGARLMMVGEQPGDQEDLAGRPFVGPAGRVLDRAITEAGIDRKAVFVTNAVKHCRWWNDLEREIVKPALVVALGATAARSLLGRTVSVSKVRGEVLTLNDMRLLVTVHPSYLLRIEDEDRKQLEFEPLVADLRICVAALEAPAE
jgi:uracil-DNA glycosylase